MFIYFVEQTSDGLVKIGLAKDPERRVQAIRSSNPNGLRLLAVCRGTVRSERLLHRYFKDYLAHGREWFTPNQLLTDLISKLPTWESVKAGGPCPGIVMKRDIVQILTRTGYSFQEIGDYFGYSRQRAHQLAQGLQFDKNIYNTAWHKRFGENRYVENRPPIAEFIEAHPDLFKTDVEIDLIDDTVDEE